ncbi:MAG: Wzt carbohydrate-binding domain-containing protein, partial [Acidimicrobiales bacterium]
DVTIAPPGEAIRAFRETLIATGETLGLPAVEDPDSGRGQAGASSAPGTSVVAGARGASLSASAALVPATPATRRVTIKACRVERPGALERAHVLPGEAVTVLLEVVARERVPNVAFGCSIWAENGALIFDCDSDMMGETHDLAPGPTSVQLEFPQMLLGDGLYAINVRIQDARGGKVHARLEPATTVEVVNPGRATGLFALPFAVRVSSAEPSRIGT